MIKTEDRQEVARELNQGLAHFYGTENYYRHALSGLRYTDGIQYLAEKAGAHWLLDAIFSYRRKEPFQVWKLEVTEGKSRRTALLTMREDTNRPIKVKQKIEFTDFPLDEIEVWLIDGVLILKSEY